MQKPSFISSLIAGAVGFVEGAIILGGIAAFLGGGVGALLGATEIISGGVLLGGLAGAINSGVIAATIGSAIGLIAGVIQHREASSPEAQDMVNMANIAFAQGVDVGMKKTVSHDSKQEVVQAAANDHSHQKMLETKQAASQSQDCQCR